MQKLLIVGCPILTRTRRKAAEELNDLKAFAVIKYLVELVGSFKDGISSVKFLASDGYFAQSPILRESINPVFLLAQGEGYATELDRSIEAVQLQIAWPFEEETKRIMDVVSMRLVLGDELIQWASGLAQKNQGLAKNLYRSIAGPLVSFIPRFATANLTIAIALAMYMENNKEVSLLDCLQYPQTWNFLSRFLRKEVGGSYEERLIIAPENVRQPWAY